MREPVEDVKPGQEVEGSLTWQTTDPIRRGARVEATDGLLGTVTERLTSQDAEQAYLSIDTDQGRLVVPEQLIRETSGNTVFLSLPAADVRAQSSAQTSTLHVTAEDAR